MKRAILNVATGSYAKWQGRLRKSMDRFGGADLMFWEDSYPDGSPTHAESSYAFKLYAIEAAEKAGYESVFWLDAGLYAIRSMEPMWSDLERDGVYFTRDDNTVNKFCSDETLAYYGITRESVSKTNIISGSIIGLVFSHPVCRELRKLWKEAYSAGLYRGTVSKHSGQEDHRGDETIIGILATKLGINLHTPADHFTSDADPRPWTILRSGYYSREDGPE